MRLFISTSCGLFILLNKAALTFQAIDNNSLSHTPIQIYDDVGGTRVRFPGLLFITLYTPCTGFRFNTLGNHIKKGKRSTSPCRSVSGTFKTCKSNLLSGFYLIQ